MVVDVPVLAQDECEELAARIEALRPQWCHRQDGFATIGVATYLDVICSKTPEESYYRRLATWNAFILREFPDTLERVKMTLAAFLGAQARFESAVALPGFHIFEGRGVATSFAPNAHFDLQHRYLRWPFALTGTDVISFTLAVKLPRLGGALDVWNVQEEDFARLQRMGRRVTMEKLMWIKPRKRHEYAVGRMAVQMRPIMHCISTVPERFPGDQRITFQGHGVRDGATWVLYW
jgi:hypothetical protein